MGIRQHEKEKGKKEIKLDSLILDSVTFITAFSICMMPISLSRWITIIWVYKNSALQMNKITKTEKGRTESGRNETKLKS